MIDPRNAPKWCERCHTYFWGAHVCLSTLSPADPPDGYIADARTLTAADLADIEAIVRRVVGQGQ